MKRTARKYMGIGFICASLFFIFNPNFIIIDILPDFIGYILLCIGLSQLSVMNDVLEEAYIGFRRMIFVDIAKISSIFVLFGLLQGNSQEQPMSMLLFAFVFGIIELLILIPAVIKLFDGIIYLASRLPTHSVVFETKKAGRKTRIEKFKIFTVIFLITKIVLSVLPEVSALSLSGTSSINQSVTLYEFINLFRTISISSEVILGIVWLTLALLLILKIRKDKLFIESVKEKFNTEITPKESFFIQKDLKSVVILFSIAIVFFLDLYFDTINIVPDAICAILLIIAALKLKGYSEYKIPCIISASFFTFSSIVAEYFSIKFNYDFSPGKIMKDAGAMSAYIKMVLSSALEALLFLVTLYFIILIFKGIINKYTGFSIGGDDHINTPHIAELQKALTIKLYIAGALAIVAAVTEVLYNYLIMYSTFNDSYWLTNLASFIGILDFLAATVFIVFFIKTLFNIYEEIENKYMLL